MVTLEKIYREIKVLQRKFDIVYSPVESENSDLEKALTEGLDDVKQGRVTGPFRSAKALMKSLRS